MSAKLFLILGAGLCAYGVPPGYITHPDPHPPTFLSDKLYSVFRKALPPPPAKTSSIQKEDEKALLTIQKSRTQEECTRAAHEAVVNLENFFGAPAGPLDEKTVKRLAGIFAQVDNDIDFYVHPLKREVVRPRPFIYLKEIQPCIPKEASNSYPSGHALVSKVYALILGDLFPEQRAVFEKRAEEIAHHRVLGGVHHPSDIEEGRKLAEVFYSEFKKAPKFQSALREVQPVDKDKK